MTQDSLSLSRTPAGGELSLPKPPGVIRQFWVRHPWWTDSIVAGIYFVPAFIATLILYFVPDTRPGWLITLWLAGAVVLGSALLFRRYRPWTVLFVAWGVTLIASPLGGNVDVVPIPIALYALAVYRSTRDAWIGLAGSVVVGTASAFLASLLHHLGSVPPFGAPAVPASSQYAILMLLATLIGINIGNRRRYLAALVDRAAQLARERDQQAQLAAASERTRIAREMHDIVSHSLTVMITLADGSVATLYGSPARSGEAMVQVAETGRQALADMRRMLGVLNDASEAGSGPLVPQPGVDDLAVLAETFRQLGLPVRLTSSGSQPTDPAVQLTVFRIVQESLTNALRYATDATSVSTEISYSAERIRIVTEDNGRASGGGNTGAGNGGAGHGLLGMRERIALYGGSVGWGRQSGAGWRVAAEFSPEGTVPTKGHAK